MISEDLFKQGLKELEIPCSPAQVHFFMSYLSELKKWNRAYNLTALKKDEDIMVKHFLDSLLYLKALPMGKLKLADVGTGAGFPGIPIKILRPEVALSLIESSRKKCAFLRHIVRTLKLSDVNVIEDRIESLGSAYEKLFDVIVSRATCGIKEFLKTAGPYVRENGLLILNKGPKVSEELKELEGLNCAKAIKSVLKFNLPVANAERNLIIMECYNVR